jgi:hypothetical protein
MTPAPPTDAVLTEERRSRPSRQAGYVVAVVINALILWVANNLLAWGWFPWLTDDFAEALPAINASLIVTIIAYALFVAYDGEWFRALGDIVTGVYSLLAGIAMWRVFPFDFTEYAFAWDLMARFVIGVGIFGVSVAILVNVVKLLGLLVRGGR